MPNSGASPAKQVLTHKPKKQSQRKEPVKAEATFPPNAWTSSEVRARGDARFSEYCNDLAAAFLATDELQTALTQALRIICVIETAMLPLATDELYVTSRLPGYTEDTLRKADKLLRTLTQQLRFSVTMPRELSGTIFEVVEEIRGCGEDRHKGTALELV